MDIEEINKAGAFLVELINSQAVLAMRPDVSEKVRTVSANLQEYVDICTHASAMHYREYLEADRVPSLRSGL